MNLCDPRHEPKYQITYKSASNYAKRTHYTPVWLVCDECMQKNHFGSEDQVESMEMLINMTNDVLSKIKQRMVMLT